MKMFALGVRGLCACVLGLALTGAAGGFTNITASDPDAPTPSSPLPSPPPPSPAPAAGTVSPFNVNAAINALSPSGASGNASSPSAISVSNQLNELIPTIGGAPSNAPGTSGTIAPATAGASEGIVPAGQQTQNQPQGAQSHATFLDGALTPAQAASEDPRKEAARAWLYFKDIFDRCREGIEGFCQKFQAIWK